MHPTIIATRSPDHPAIVVAETGETITYEGLDRASNRAAQLFRARGLRRGDTIAICLENTPRMLEIAWGAQRAGLVYVCVSSRLTKDELVYILQDSQAELLVTSGHVEADIAAVAAAFGPDQVLVVGGGVPGLTAWEAVATDLPGTPIADESAGVDMLYSSGTTGRPKGIQSRLPDNPAIDAPNLLADLMRGLVGINEDSVYLCPAPLYHAAPLRWSMAAHRLGATIVLMSHFDPEEALKAIQTYGVTAGQFVPTHFIRMLKLPETVRTAYDVGALKCAIHAAAPCPVEIKRQMIEWWGPILLEYYAGSESNGMTLIDTAQWLTHPGSVGRGVVGHVRICDDDGEPLAAGQVGLIHFEGGPAFTYHNDPAKQADATNRHGWTSLGDIGWVDDDGYLYLTDRKSFMIISGGVNIYPQEIENLLVTHPKVADAAVIGAPDPEMGERVVAVVQPAAGIEAGDALADELRLWLRQSLSGVKMPRQIDFTAELPREPTGKLYKRLIRDAYWKA